MSGKKGASKPAERSWVAEQAQKPEVRKQIGEEEEMHGVTVVEWKGNIMIGKSILYHHPGLDTWSTRFIIPGYMPTWVALPNEKIARGAYAGGPPYEDGTDSTADGG